eukprot:3887728-Prymnesium_polylepis.1
MSANVESADGRDINCPFKASRELSDASRNNIRKLTREAARLLRGEQSPKLDESASLTPEESPG